MNTVAVAIDPREFNEFPLIDGYLLLLLYPKPEDTVTNRARAIATATVFMIL
jgi:hypothetical protein